jgi:hypothetical protein
MFRLKSKPSSGVIVYVSCGILLVDYLEIGANIVVKYYAALLDNLKQQLVSKYQDKLS